MNRLKSSTRVQLLAAAGFLSVISFLGATVALPGGITTDLANERGANIAEGCHAPIASSSVIPILEGVPQNYTMMDTPADEYEPREFELNITVEGGPESDRAGFNLLVSGGSLSVHPEEDEGRVQFSEDNDEATHTSAGDTGRTWRLIWTAPDEPGEAVLFRLTTQVINAEVPPPSDNDEWNRLSLLSEGEHGAQVGAEDHGIRVEDLGVNWLAYWVGIVSFVFLGVILLVYYVVFRYGETSKATDHRARKDKKK